MYLLCHSLSETFRQFHCLLPLDPSSSVLPGIVSISTFFFSIQLFAFPSDWFSGTLLNSSHFFRAPRIRNGTGLCQIYVAVGFCSCAEFSSLIWLMGSTKIEFRSIFLSLAFTNLLPFYFLTSFLWLKWNIGK